MSLTNATAVSIGTAKTLIKKFIKGASLKPTVMHSSPGVGKSAIVKQIAAEEDALFIDVRLSSMESSDVQGIPFVSGEDMHFSTPFWFSKAEKGAAEGKPVVLFFDELNNAAIDVQKAAYRIILDREIQNGKVLPDAVKIIAAGNLKSDKTGAKDMVPALANRFAFHLDIKASKDDFVSWANGAGIDQRVIGFLEWKPDAIYRFDPARNEHSFPTPRSWEAMSEILSTGYTDDELPPVVGGCVGQGTSAEFMSFLKYYQKLPSMDDIANGKIDYKVDNSDRGVVFALTSSLIGAAAESIDSEDRIKNLWKVVDQLEDEFIALIYRSLKQRGDQFLVSMVRTTMNTWKRVSKKI